MSKGMDEAFQICITSSLGALLAPTSSWWPFGSALGPSGLLDFVIRALRALRLCDPRRCIHDACIRDSDCCIHKSWTMMHVSTMHVSMIHAGADGYGFSTSGRIGFGYWKKLSGRVGFGLGFGYWYHILNQSGIIEY